MGGGTGAKARGQQVGGSRRSWVVSMVLTDNPSDVPVVGMLCCDVWGGPFGDPAEPLVSRHAPPRSLPPSGEGRYGL